MPRRATSSEAPDDVTVKMERIKVKQEKLKGKQKAHAIEEQSEEQDNEQDAEGDADEHAWGEQGEDEEESTPRGNKRVRVNGEGSSRPGIQQLPRMKTLPRDTDGYACYFFSQFQNVPIPP